MELTKEAHDRAVEHFLAEVHNPAFFAKCAELGHVPRDEREAQQMLNIGFRLFRNYSAELESQAQKQAQAHSSYLDLAEAHLDAFDGVAPAQDREFRKASQYLLKDPATALAARILARQHVA